MYSISSYTPLKTIIVSTLCKFLWILMFFFSKPPQLKHSFHIYCFIYVCIRTLIVLSIPVKGFEVSYNLLNWIELIFRAYRKGEKQFSNPVSDHFYSFQEANILIYMRLQTKKIKWVLPAHDGPFFIDQHAKLAPYIFILKNRK